MTLQEYLEAEFRRYYPEARILVEENMDDELIEVAVFLTGEEPITYDMAIGSDDEYYDFISHLSGRHLTIPLSAVELESSETEDGPDCETCDDEGTITEFRRFAGEAVAGEPVEIPCPDCQG